MSAFPIIHQGLQPLHPFFGHAFFVCLKLDLGSWQRHFEASLPSLHVCDASFGLAELRTQGDRIDISHIDASRGTLDETSDTPSLTVHEFAVDFWEEVGWNR